MKIKKKIFRRFAPEERAKVKGKVSKVIRISKQTEEYIEKYRDTLIKELGLERDCIYSLWDYFQKDDNVIKDALRTAIDNVIKKG